MTAGVIDRLPTVSLGSAWARIDLSVHNAVAVAAAQNRAGWGFGIGSVAVQYEPGFIPVQDEFYDSVIPRAHRPRAAVERFCAVLQDPSVRAELAALAFKI